MSADRETLRLYDARAEDYAARFSGEGPGTDLRDFMAELPPRARVLDLGCGPGTASVHMAEAGFDPDPVDASSGMVEAARARGLNARLGSFDDIEGEGIYDGVWANFCLLHAPRDALPRHIAAIARALRPGGVFHIGMKTGTGEARDDLGRFYTFVTVDELTGLLNDAGLNVTHRREGAEKGFAGTVDPYVILRARKD